MQTIQLVNQPIDPAKWAHCLHDIDTGSHLWFSGVTRRKTTDSSGQTTVTRTLHYEAYAEMAIEQLERLAKDARLRFELSGVVIIH
ncbi:MAG: molybdenum cofactor biosynthesis protein MoaE, partial [Myxococcota bacterium]